MSRGWVVLLYSCCDLSCFCWLANSSWRLWRLQKAQKHVSINKYQPRNINKIIFLNHNVYVSNVCLQSQFRPYLQINTYTNGTNGCDVDMIITVKSWCLSGTKSQLHTHKHTLTYMCAQLRSERRGTFDLEKALICSWRTLMLDQDYNVYQDIGLRRSCQLGILFFINNSAFLDFIILLVFSRSLLSDTDSCSVLCCRFPRKANR